ncbi:hypothetical protein SNOG_02075 [Parastagonospora nodorum SN15]|uniref:Uncharacterized protein n=1 Tax=Phaeosphaeria nodorum (strain SN15 / ATCC MYA-4574 / FGSC 10173) TaxID=321614 RepID=Q0V1N9_PHANO|nr:hypothetical protein SNOG_02075 [Parastagonospora nodorum SN15]EAT90287.2 hypothetical protein SNOG_02075 [Parastagonospora nodorum SN15]
MSMLSPEKLNASSNSIHTDDDFDMTFHDPPSSPFVSHIEINDQENIAPGEMATPSKSLLDFDDVPQSAFKVSPEKKSGLKERASPMKTSPVKNLMGDFEDAAREESTSGRSSPRKSSPGKKLSMERSESAMSSRSRKSQSPSKLSRTPSAEPIHRAPTFETDAEVLPTPSSRASSSHREPVLRENEGLTVAMKFMEEMRTERQETLVRQRSYEDKYDIDLDIDNTEFNPDGPSLTSADVDDTSFSMFSEMPGIDMTKFAFLQKSPTKDGFLDPDLRSFYQNQRSPAKGGSYVPSTPSQSRQMLNLLDFELPPPPTPRSLPTVTIRELESAKSQFQSQISSLSASLSGKEAEVDSLAKAVADAERRVGEAQEAVREESSAREYAEAQMIDWKKKGEEVQNLLQDVQAELARNDSEREQLLQRLAEAEKRADDAENRSTELETKVIEAESKNVDMTTFINNDDGEENKKIYSELECQTAIAEKVNEVARDLHSAYKAKHEKKIKALKDNYQKKADERCKELRLQIIRLERQVEEAEKKRDDTFSKVLPAGVQPKADDPSTSVSNSVDLQKLEAQRAEIENLKAKLAGLQSELQSLRKSNDSLLVDLEAERVEKGELVAAAEQMLSMCGQQMEEMQQDELRRSQSGSAPPSAPPKQKAPAENAMRNTGFLAGGPAPPRPGSSLAAGRPGSALGDRSTGIAKPSGLRAPGGFGFQSGNAGLNRSASGGKSRLLSNIERMGGGKGQE